MATENVRQLKNSDLFFQEEHVYVPEPIEDNREEYNDNDDEVGTRTFAVSGCCAGMIGGCFGYLTSSSDFSTEQVTLTTMASTLASMVTIGLFLQTPQVARTVNTCIKKLDYLADEFMN